MVEVRTRRKALTVSNFASQDQVEAVGADFRPDLLLNVRARTRAAVYDIAAQIVPGMTEPEARALAAAVLRDRGLRKGWHKILVRFGPNTTKNFEDPSDPGVILGADDIFFVDIGPIYQGCEGDAGVTFFVGDDPEMIKAVTDVRAIWDATRRRWLDDGLTGRALYEYAAATSEARGWTLDLELTGHRLSEFPHSAHFDGTLDGTDFRPTDLRWILEIQIRHPRRNFGAFHEDLLIEDDEVQSARPSGGD